MFPRRAESSNSSSGANNMDIDKPPVSLCKENQNTKPQTPLKVYRHEKRTISNKKEQKDLTTKSNECQVEKIDGEKKPCIVSPHEDNKPLTVNHAAVAVQQKNDGYKIAIVSPFSATWWRLLTDSILTGILIYQLRSY